MVEVRRLVEDDWEVWRAVRLAALADAPYAYGSTLAREQAFDEATWRSRLSRDNGTCAVAVVAGQVVGAVGGHTPPGAGSVMLVGLWADPGHRGRGVGDALVVDLLAWARENSWPRVELRVAEGNAPARGLFARHGFTATGRREPLESDPSVSTVTLARPV